MVVSAERAGRTERLLALPPLNGSTTLPSRLYEQLELAIIAGTLQPGQRLHADDLAAHFGVSRIPVREALSSLDQAGWVEIKPRHGVHVRERTVTELQELFEFRADVEALVARWAAQRRTEDDLIRLEQAVSNTHSTVAASEDDQPGAFIGFREALRQAAHNSVLAAASSGLEKRARFYFSTVEDQLGDDWIHLEGQVLELVRRRDAEGAAAMTSRHILDTGHAVHRLLFDHKTHTTPAAATS